MSKRQLALTISIALVVIGYLYFGLAVFFPVDQQQELFPVNEEHLTDATTSAEIAETPTPAPINPEQTTRTELMQTGWIADWAFDSGYSSFADNVKYFDSISPVWYSVNSAGKIISKQVGYDKLISLAKSNGVEVIPSIASFSADDMHKVFSNDSLLEEHISYLINEVEKYGYDGLDLDYESIYLEDKPEFIYLASKLYDYMDSHNKTLSIAVMPTWTNADIYRTLRQTREVQDWAVLGQYCHELRIMTYNLTNYTSTYPGPVAPLDWLEATLRYAVTKVDPDKIVLGISQYGYDGWSNNPKVASPYLGMLANSSQAKAQADAVTYGQVLGRATTKVSDELDPSAQEKLMTYTYKGKEYFIYYQDEESAKLRYELAEKYGIAGVAHWRLGDEHPDVYKVAK